MIIVTGGTGFIGSALVWALNKRGIVDILVVDELDHDEKEKNMAPLSYEQLVGIKEFREQLKDGYYDNKGVQAIIHLGACSDTTEQDWDYLQDNNVEYSKEIIRWCQEKDVRCIYASSGATYGDGEQGFSDDHELFDQLKPLNLYGQSKLDVDIWARDGGFLEGAVGVRFFNVYGPNESHKEHMRSVIAKKVPEIQETGKITLFKSDHPEYKDGEQQRDFVYIKYALEALLFFLDHPEVNGVFNVGTGEARTWNEVAHAMFEGLGKEPSIEYIDLPANLKGQYQYYTMADTEKIKQAGFTAKPEPLHDCIVEYVSQYLVPEHHLGEE